jgi:hypothetical protein
MAPWWWPSVATSGLRVLDGSSQGEQSSQRDYGVFAKGHSQMTAAARVTQAR